MYEYCVGDSDYCYELLGIGDGGTEYPELLAKLAAQNYFDEHNGWDASWPIELELFNENQSIGRFEVEKETEPKFYAARIEGD